jgi:NAD(P)-dependent dehydrogenase (short-subunit alcohol dehydrogenase family)
MARDTCDSISHGKEMAMRVLDRFRLDGKRLFVTGGSRGLGREMALAIADAGADAVLVGRDLASLEKTAIDVRALGRKAWTIQGDAGIPAECERICRTALEEFGPIDILINNVGGRRVNIPTQDMPLDTWLQMLDLNLTSTFLCTKLIGGAMVARGKGGRIINIASINALVSNRGIAGRHYETAKAAVLQFTRATAADWAPLGITVNAILPGGFMTRGHRDVQDTDPDGRPRQAGGSWPPGRLSRERRLALHDRGGPRHRRRLHTLVIRHDRYARYIPNCTRRDGSAFAAWMVSEAAGQFVSFGIVLA